MKKIRSRKAVPLSTKQKNKIKKRIFFYSVWVSMVVSVPWIFPQMIRNNQVLAALSHDQTGELANARLDQNTLSQQKLSNGKSDSSQLTSTKEGDFVHSNANQDSFGVNSSDQSNAGGARQGIHITQDGNVSNGDTREGNEGDAQGGENNEDRQSGARSGMSTQGDSNSQNEPNNSKNGEDQNSQGDSNSENMNSEQADSDASGSLATPQPSYMSVDNSYFDDALFIGDSRTVGLYEYGGLNNADFFCTTGLNSFTALNSSVKVKNFGRIKLVDLLAQKKYGKIYVMLGINEVGNPFESIMAKYNELIVTIQKANPGSTIYLQGNLHVTAHKSTTHPYITNDRINILNAYIAGNADNITVFYLNPNEYFDDASGSLKKELTGDDIHIYAKYYVEWIEWLKQRAVVRS